MADEEATEFLDVNSGIKNFLTLADLSQFEFAFKSEGITKVLHIRDVTNEDLRRIGE